MPTQFPPIRTVFFDMGNVLVQFSHDLMLQQLAELCGTTAPQMRRCLIDSRYLTAFERGEHSENEVIRMLESEFDCTLVPSEFRHAFSDIFTLTPGIDALLKRMRQSPIQLVLLSNTSVTHLDFIERNFNVLDAMHAKTTSFAAGACKPDPAIYDAALQMADCSPEECFYTDDIAEYIAAARSRGIRGTQFVSTQQLAADLRAAGILTD